MKRRAILLVLLAAVFLAAIWQFQAKRSTITIDNLTEAWHTLTGVTPKPPLTLTSSATPATPAEPEEDAGPPTADPAPQILAATEGEMYPFPADTPILEALVPLPDKRVPLVYVAHGHDMQDNVTSASEMFGEFFKCQVQAPRTGPLLINTVPNNDMLTSLRRAYTDIPDKISYESYLKDATELGCDFMFCPIYDGETSRGVVTIKMADLNSSRTETWSSEQSHLTSPQAMLIAGAEAALRFAGFSDAEIAETSVKNGAPKDATFAWYVDTDQTSMTFEALSAIADSDPDCVYTYSIDGGTTYIGQLIDMGLHRFPADPRLLTRKSTALYDAQCTHALVRYLSELMRRYPDHMFTYYKLGDKLVSVFPAVNNSHETPAVYAMMARQQELICNRYSKNFALNWDHAYTLRNLANYIRGGKTVDRIPPHIWPERSKYLHQAFKIMDSLVHLQPDNPDLLKAFIHYYDDVESMDGAEQKEYINRIAALDPRETEVEVAVASSHSIGYGSQKDFFIAMDRAFKHHAGDPHATADLAAAMREELYRQVGWKEMTMDDAHSTPNPYTNRFSDAADFVYSTGGNLGFESDWAYYLITDHKHNQARLDEWKRTGQNSYYALKLAWEAHDAGDWQTCLKQAQSALPFVLRDDKGLRCHYFVVKSLWKLKRYEESLSASRRGIMLFPKEQAFPYMYSIVASEAGTHLQTAYDCAWRAVDISTNNPGCNNTFEKLRKKLGKPDHPALVALKK